MTSIEQLIGDLLLRHNCVIVPSFGGFVAKQVSAKIDFSKGTMSPPTKSLLFNRQLVNNDGLLINELSQQNGISFDEASTEVSDKVKRWNKTLKSGGRVELDRVGILYFDDEQNICFEQDRFYNLLLASFGLGQVHFLTEDDVKMIQAEALSNEILIEETEVAEPVVEVKKETPIVELKKQVEVKEKELVVEKPTPVVPIKQPRKKRKYWRYAVAACLLPIAFYSVWIPMKTDVLESGVISIKDFNPFYESTDGQYTNTFLPEDCIFEKEEIQTLDEKIADVETDVEVYSYDFAEDFNIPVKIERSETEVADNNVESTPEEQPVVEDASVIASNSMHFIVGCFGNETNAKNLVKKLKSEGFDALIVDIKNGLHRVSAGAALSDQSLQSIKNQAQSSGYDGWVLK